MNRISPFCHKASGMKWKVTATYIYLSLLKSCVIRLKLKCKKIKATRQKQNTINQSPRVKLFRNGITVTEDSVFFFICLLVVYTAQELWMGSSTLILYKNISVAKRVIALLDNTDTTLQIAQWTHHITLALDFTFIEIFLESLLFSIANPLFYKTFIFSNNVSVFRTITVQMQSSHHCKSSSRRSSTS